MHDEFHSSSFRVIHPLYQKFIRLKHIPLRPEDGVAMEKALEEKQWAVIARICQAEAFGEAKSTVALYWLGLVRFRQKLLEQAEAALKEAVRREPGYADAWCFLGLVTTTLGDHRGALESLWMAIGIQPRNCLAWGRLSLCYYALGWHDHERLAIERQIEINPNVEGARRRLRELIDGE